MTDHQKLRLFFSDVAFNDYRLREGRLEFRINEGAWRPLNESEMQLHFRFNTEVSRWLRRQLMDANPFIQGIHAFRPSRSPYPERA
jgi:hypothetical protein